MCKLADAFKNKTRERSWDKCGVCAKGVEGPRGKKKARKRARAKLKQQDKQTANRPER